MTIIKIELMFIAFKLKLAPCTKDVCEVVSLLEKVKRFDGVYATHVILLCRMHEGCLFPGYNGINHLIMRVTRAARAGNSNYQ